MGEDMVRNGVRLQKVLAEAGLGSRRACELLITSGRVTVNGRVIDELGVRVDPQADSVALDGRQVSPRENKWYVALHKPHGYVSTASDPQGRPTVLDLTSDIPVRLYPVGRLDMDSEGLILLTNDGELTNALLHPRFHVPRRYCVHVDGRVSEAALRRLRDGITLEDGPTAPAEVDVLDQGPDGTSLQFVLYEGRKRQIRRMCDVVGHPVRRLFRVAMGPVELGQLRPGEYRQLSHAEIAALLQAAKTPAARGV